MPVLVVAQAWWCVASSSPFQLASHGFRDPPGQRKNGRDGAMREGNGRQENAAMREGKGRQENGAMREGKGRQEAGALGEAEEAGRSRNRWRKQAESSPDFAFNMLSNYPPIPPRGKTGTELGSLFYRDAKIASRRYSRSAGSRSSPSRSSIPAKFSKYSKEVGGKSRKGNGIPGKSSTGLVTLPWLLSDKADVESSEFEGDTLEGRASSSSDRRDAEVSRTSSDYPRTWSPALTLPYQSKKKDANYDENDEGAKFIDNADGEVSHYDESGKDEHATFSDSSNSPATPRVAHAENCQVSSSTTHPVSDLPFEFRYSYSETPKVAPLCYREPQFSPFGPKTMGRPWTGRAPLKPSKKKVPEFDSFKPPPSGKKGVKYVQNPGPFIEGQGPREAKSREEILGEPLSKEEVAVLVNTSMREQRQINLGSGGSASIVMSCL